MKPDKRCATSLAAMLGPSPEGPEWFMGQERLIRGAGKAEM